MRVVAEESSLLYLSRETVRGRFPEAKVRLWSLLFLAEVKRQIFVFFQIFLRCVKGHKNPAMPKIHNSTSLKNGNILVAAALGWQIRMCRQELAVEGKYFIFL